MGANAVTTVYDFTAGQVLTAEQMDNVNSGIPVFATTVTRDAAFGGAGEKTLAEGQFAYIEATNTTQYYDGAAWQPVATAPQVAIFNETQASGTPGGTPGAPGSFHKRILNTTVVNNITGCSLASSVITLPAGTYSVNTSIPFLSTLKTQVKLRNTTDSTDTMFASNGYMVADGHLNITMLGYFTITGSKNFEIQYRVGSNPATFGLGVDMIFGTTEIYAVIQITKVA